MKKQDTIELIAATSAAIAMLECDTEFSESASIRMVKLVSRCLNNNGASTAAVRASREMRELKKQCEERRAARTNSMSHL